MKRAVLSFFLILFISFGGSGCSSMSKPDVPKKTEVVSSSRAENIIQDKSIIFKNRTEDLDKALFKKVDEESSTLEKLKILFKALEEDSTINGNYTMYNCDNVLTYTMDLLYNFLGTEQSFNISDSEFEKLFGFPVKPLKEGRIIQYEGKPENFGESSDSKYIFYQRKWGNIVSAYKLYFKDYRRVTDVFVINTGIDNNIIYTCGFTSMNLGSRDFIHAFRIDSKTCTKIDAFEQYMYKNNEFISSEGLIPHEIQIGEFTKDEIVFYSGEDKSNIIKAHFNSKKKKIIIDR
jgi:hypothetical protein